MVKLIFKMTFPIFCVCLMVFISLMPSQNPSVFNGFKVNGNHWTRHVKIFHPQFLCPINRQLSDILKFSIFQKMMKGTFYGFNNGYLGHLNGFPKIITFLKIMIFPTFSAYAFSSAYPYFKHNFSILDEKRYRSHMWRLKNWCSRQQKLFQRKKNGPQKYWSADNVEKWNKLYPNIWPQHRIIQIYHFRPIHNV